MRAGPVASPGAAASPTDPGWRRRLPGWSSLGQRDGSAVAFGAVSKFWQANTAGALRRELRSQTRSSPKVRHSIVAALHRRSTITPVALSGS
jgi:hypothetical protein